MFKNLNADYLGVTGRQSELIELVLTFRFRGLDLDMGDLLSRAQKLGAEKAVRFLKGSPITIGAFDLPIHWKGDEQQYQEAQEHLKLISEMAADLGATRCVLDIEPVSDALPYHENFEMHRQRLSEIAAVLGEHGVQLGLGLDAAPGDRGDGQFQFVQQADDLLTFIKTVGSPNVGLALDTWEWRLGGGTLEQLQSLNAEQFVSVRLADLSPEADLAAAGAEQRVVPYEEGIVDNLAVIKLLAEKGYQGPVALAVSPTAFEGMTRDAIAQQAHDVIESLFLEAGLDKSGQPANVSADA